MLSLRETDYETDEGLEQAFSRLTWAVEKVDGLAGQLIGSFTVETSRPWVGVYNKEKMTFGLIEPRDFSSFILFHVVVRGHMYELKNKTFINIKLRLGAHTFVMFSMLYLSIPMMIGFFFDRLVDPMFCGYLIFLGILCVILTIMLKRKLNTIEEKIEDLFGLH